MHLFVFLDDAHGAAQKWWMIMLAELDEHEVFFPTNRALRDMLGAH